MKKVLIVEDDEPMLDLLRLFFRRSDLAVEFAMSGAEALEKLQPGDADLLVLDLMLPEVSGMELLDELRREGRRLPAVIVITGDAAAREDRVRARPEVVDFFRKPLDHDRFMAAAERALYAPPDGEPRP